MESTHDEAFLQILREEKYITNFLDAFFGFLYRCTDFYVASGPDQKLGFPPGVAEELVLNSLQKWKNISKFPRRVNTPKPQETRSQCNTTHQDDSTVVQENLQTPPVAQEVQIGTCKQEKQPTSTTAAQSLEKNRSSDSYNGAVRENYTWSQSINDLDVIIKLPSSLKTAKDLKVNLESQKIKVEARTSMVMEEQQIDKSTSSEWITIFEGELCFKTRKDESMWSIVPGQSINIHLEKASERWWEALIIGEPKIELRKIDCSRNLDEMGSEEQMKVQELVWNHQQKLLGKPTSEQIKMENILKKAWDAKGSPFEGTPYDPSILKFN